MMDRTAVVSVVLGLTCFQAVAQSDTLAEHYAKTITEGELRTHLTILAADDYLGRETGKEGQKLAMEYLKQQFVRMGVPSVPKTANGRIDEGYFQPFALVEERSGSIGITGAGTRLEFMKDLLYFNEPLQADLLVRRVIWMGDGSGIASMDRPTGSVLVVQAPDKDASSTMAWMRTITEAANKNGAVALLVATDSMAQLVGHFGQFVSGGRMRLAADATGSEKKRRTQTILVDGTALDRLMGKNDRASLRDKRIGGKVRVRFSITRQNAEQQLQGENVLAYIEGSDKKDELVVITAHYDHLGVENGVVYNGADDDGTGTVALLEIADAFMQAKAEGHGPRRSVLVMPVSGEEKGLLGSRYYSDHPVFPLERTVADLNIDMIGRSDSAHASGPPYVYVIGSDRLSSELHAVNEQANTRYVGLSLDYTFNAEDDPNRFYYRSDHYNFARKGIPSIFYFSGVHEDYHQPGDDVEKIQFDLLLQRTKLVFHTAWTLADREDRPMVDKPAR